jgi:hypothetical protein
VPRLMVWRCLLLVALMLAGCNDNTIPSSITLLPATTVDNRAEELGDNQLEIQFLGAGGVFLRTRNQSLLGDPFFSNPPLSDWFLLRDLKVRTDVIDHYLPPLDKLQGILVAHAHHDHAMDVPYIAQLAPNAAKVYGSETLKNTLASGVNLARLVSLNQQAAGPGQAGEWIYLSPTLRILPILSGHAPHLFGRVLQSESVLSPKPQLPDTILDWQSGQTLSFVIDFLSASEQPQFRIFYQSSASEWLVDTPPDWLLNDGKVVDLALLGVANHKKLEHYPGTTLALLRPRYVMLIHWEVFWDEYNPLNTNAAPGLDLAGLAMKIATQEEPNVPVYLPQRGARLRIDAQ